MLLNWGGGIKKENYQKCASAYTARVQKSSEIPRAQIRIDLENINHSIV